MSTIPPLDNNNPEDLGTPLKAASFCIPIVGAVLYFVNKDEHPAKAKQACTFAIYGVIFSVVLNIIFGVLGVFAGG